MSATITDVPPETASKSGTVFGDVGFTPSFHALTKQKSPTTLKWENICLTINGRTILDNITGSVSNGQVCALLGPSGAGKSSLLNILSGRIAPSKKKKVMSGNMLVNNQVVSPFKFRKHVAYVMQDDALFATATAREALEFSAKLRLPSSVSNQERTQLIDELIVSLGIEHVQHTYCGSALVRGLSGGEKKRVAIGVELVTNPKILFLDEPTSGLDSYSSWKVVCILSALAKSGCACLCTIHQPSSEIFNVFDKVMLLARGKVLYNGSVTSLPAVLEQQGFTLPPLTNPADYVMMLAQTLEAAELPQYNEETGVGVQVLEPVNLAKAADDKALAAHISVQQDDEYTIQAREGSSILELADNDDGFSAERTSTWGLQIYLLAIREMKNVRRDTKALGARIGITIFLNLLFGSIFFRAADTSRTDYLLGSHFGALVNMFIAGLFSAAQPPLLTFPQERIVFLREYSTGTYSSSPYFLSKVVVELPVYFLVSCIIIAISYPMIGFNGSAIMLLVEVFFIQIVSASYAFVMGAAAHDAKQAQEVVPLVFVPQLLFAGLFIKISQIPSWLQWVQYLCSLKYAMNLASITEFDGNNCKVDGNSTLSSIRIADCHSLLVYNDVNPNLLWLYVLLMLAIFVCFRVASLAILVWRARNFTT
mmetsp:Transcript_8772/g.16344  ORF Transcript_8772/g.16344 Transcript_8772/m.16344 type:complete len:652 (-) Transcript_8772:2368-4323(-)